MKIALITYHYGYNEGTLLQAYATLALLKKAFPAGEVKIIDWRYPAKEAIVFAEPRTGRERELRAFFDTRIERTDQTFRATDPREVFDHVKRDYDLVVIGSDELWRLEYRVSGWGPFKRHRQSNVWAPPYPNIYWPDASRLGRPCVSLASSISEQNELARIPPAHRQALRSALKNLSFLTFRDSRTLAFVQELVGPDLPRHQWLPDPTFALPPLDAAQLSAIQAKLQLPPRDPSRKIALVISHTPGPVLDRVIARCKAQGFTVVVLTHPLPGADVDLSAAAIGPLEWAHASAFADLLITDRFHGAVFALKNNTPVIALDYRSQVVGTESKIKDLFSRFGIERYWYPLRKNELDKPDDLGERLANLGHDWPREQVRRTCEEFSARLHDFVQGPLQEICPK